MKWCVLACFVSLIFPTFAQAKTGNELKELALADPQGFGFKGGVFYGYVEAVADARYREFCIPQGVTRQQAVDVVKKFLFDNPATLHLPADDLVVQALRSAWPCR